MAHTIDDAIYDGCDKSYNPNLSKNQWLNLLNDKEIFTENSLKLLKRILHSNGKASCAELAAIYGGDANLYNRNASALGQRVYKKTNCTLYSSGKDFYLIVFTGSYNSDNRYDFILRPELWNALEELGGENGVLLHDVPLYERGEKKLNVYKFKIMIKIYKELLKDYKDLYNEQYKWSLLTNFNGKPNLDDEDFIKDFKRIFRNNLSSLQAQQFANELLKNHLDEYKNILRYLYDEKIDLVERLKFFKEETSRLLGKNSNQDERFASVLLSVKYPEKYTFYKKENVYDDFCSYLYIETERPYNRYKHYLEILNQLEKYVEQDKELVELNKEFTKDIDNCFYSNKLLIQDILFILFGWQRGTISTQTYIFPFSKESDFTDGKSSLSLKLWQRQIKEGDIVFIFSTKENRITDIYIAVSGVGNTKLVRFSKLEANNDFTLDFLNKIGYQGKLKNIELLDPNVAESIFEELNEKYENIGDTQMQQTTYTKHASLISLLKANHNLIFHGAPGTGKTFTAKEMAAQMIFDGDVPENYENDPKFKEQFGFVQFHPSYDYTDFVEGLRPCKNDGGQNVSGFERVDGVFKKFCKRAVINQKNAETDNFTLEGFKSYLNESGLNDRTKRLYFLRIEQLLGNKTFSSTYLKTEFCIYKSLDEIYYNYEEIKFFDIDNNLHYNFSSAVLKLAEFKDELNLLATVKNQNSPFIFLIDEINRGETSKIFGELFFSIDPGYRGISGRITTQYQNLVEGGEFAKGFYVPENVYIIGTMNDIDRSVETMDFAFRRRFAWKEIKAKDTQNMLDSLINVNGITEETINLAKAKMDAINQKIAETSDLDESYQIGAAYFMKLRQYGGDFEALWNYHIKGLITEYLRGQGDLEKLVAEFKTVYDGTSVKQTETVFVQNNAVLDKDSTTIIKNFRNWLSQKDYSENTINAYCSWIPRILNEENTNMKDFITNIDKMCTEYDIGGEKADKGEIGHATVRNALKRFSEFSKL